MGPTRKVRIGGVVVGGGNPLVLIAGPCVIESRSGCLAIARWLARFARAEGVPLIFKASYDKANRSALSSYRGPGLERGLEVLREVREQTGLPVLTDVHTESQAEQAAEVVDALQIPAFLCRQTDLVLAAGRTGRPVNVKKGQFMAPEDMRHVVAKVESTGNRSLLLTERGTCFGYHNLVTDLRALPILRGFGYPVVFDATHSVQRPGAGGDHSGGDRRWVPLLARAAVAAGCDAVFLETHPEPARARSDAETMIPCHEIPELWQQLRKLDEIVRGDLGHRRERHADERTDGSSAG